MSLYIHKKNNHTDQYIMSVSPYGISPAQCIQPTQGQQPSKDKKGIDHTIDTWRPIPKVSQHI